MLGSAIPLPPFRIDTAGEAPGVADASTVLIPPSAPLGLLSSQAELLVADATTTLTVSGNGDVLEPHDGVMAIGEA